MRMPAHDLTVTGTMTPKEYSLTLYVDGKVYSSESVPFGTQIAMDDPDVAPGRVFTGDEDIPETMPAHDLALHGHTAIEVNVEEITDYTSSLKIRCSHFESHKSDEVRMPYIYSLAGKTYLDDYTIMRPMVMDFTKDINPRNLKDQYMFGLAFLVVPVY